jgi:thiol-disulfide isomerase/thioredoxin
MKLYITTVLFISFSWLSNAQLLITVNEPAPTIHITEWILNEPDEKNLANQFLVVYFWASWCSSCIASTTQINQLFDNYKDRVSFISITNESRDKVEQILNRIEFKSTVVNDTTLVTSQSYGKIDNSDPLLPLTVLIDNNNIIKWIGTPYYLTEDIMDQFVNGALNGENAIQDIELYEDMSDQTYLDQFKIFYEWFTYVKNNHDVFFDITPSKIKDPSSIKDAHTFAAESITLYDLLSMVWKTNERNIKLPKKLGAARYQVMYRNVRPIINFNEDFANSILKALNLSVTSVPIEVEGYQVALENPDLLMKTKDDTYSFFSENNGVYSFTRFKIQDALDKVASHVDSYLLYSFSNQEYYDFKIDISSEKKLVKSLNACGFILTKTSGVIEKKIVTAN